MKKFIKKTIVFLTTVSMIVTGLNISPVLYENMNAMAVEANLNEVNSIMREDLSLRTTNSSTYELRNGNKMLEIYSDDIRYYSDGQYVDYDNSLSQLKVADEQKLEYIAESGTVIESDNTGKYVLSNESGDSKQFFADEISQDTPVILAKDDYALSFSPITGADDIQDSENKIVLTESKEDTLCYEEQINEENNNDLNKIIYKYISENSGVKEEIVLTEKPSTNIFGFHINANGLTAQLDDRGNIRFTDSVQGEEKAFIPAPNIKDESETVSYEDVSYRLAENNGYDFEIVVNEDYLNSANYPVTIDPTVVWVIGNAVSGPSGMPSSYRLETGYDEDGNECVEYFRYTDAMRQLQGKYIESACFNATIEQIRENPVINVMNTETVWNFTGANVVYPTFTNQVFSTYEFTTEQEEDEISIDITDIFRYQSFGNTTYGMAFVTEYDESNPYVSFYGAAVSGKRAKIQIEYCNPIDMEAQYHNDFEISASFNDDTENIDISFDKYSSDAEEYGVFAREDDGDFKYIGNINNDVSSDSFSYSYVTKKDNLGVPTTDTIDLRVAAIYENQTNILSNIVTFFKESDEITQTDENQNEITTTVYFYSPTSTDTDGDGLIDGYEIWDLGTLWNTETENSTEEEPEYETDTDGDGFPDRYEVFVLGTDPAVVNTSGTDGDGDYLLDIDEYRLGTDPWNVDSDFDGVPDGGDTTPLRTNQSTSQAAAYDAQPHIGLFDYTKTETKDNCQITTVSNVYSGQIKKETFDYTDNNLDKVRKYFYNGKEEKTAVIECGTMGATGTICTTYTYQDGRVVYICDQNSKYTIGYDTSGEETGVSVGNQDVIGFTNTVLQSNAGENVEFEEGDVIYQQQQAITYGNNQSVRKVSTTYYTGEDETMPDDTIEYYIGSDTAPSYKEEYDEDGNLIKSYDYTQGNSPVVCEYVNDDNVTEETRSDGFSKTMQTTGEEEGDSDIALTYEYQNLEEESETKSESTSFENGNNSISKTLFTGDISEYEMSNQRQDYVHEYRLPGSSETFLSEEEHKLAGSISHELTYGNTTKTWQYIKDDAGNITEIKENGITKFIYEYDCHGRLTASKNMTTHKGHKYIYNSSGNIYADREYSLNTSGEFNLNSLLYATLSEYNNSQWPDQLTNFDGEDITYDGAGNPVEYYNGYTFSWSKGKNLTSVTQEQDIIASYQYNLRGLRTKKATSDKQVTYTWDNDDLIREVVEFTNQNTKYDVWYLYDADSEPIGFEYSYISGNDLVSNRVYYEKNMFGDVIGLINTSGYKMATYEYDEWGNLTYSYCSPNGYIPYSLNNIRYRGYYFDAETDLYYVKSRYYDSLTHRFISPDDTKYLNSGSNVYVNNLYLYCMGNPITYFDESGMAAKVVGCTRRKKTGKGYLYFAKGYTPKYAYDGVYWENSMLKYNCYAFATGVTNKCLNPGNRTNIDWYRLGVYETSKYVRKDLEKRGYKVKTVTKKYVLKNKETLIAIRVGHNDFHFMKKVKGGQWKHKPGITAVLTLLRNPWDYPIWHSEYLTSIGVWSIDNDLCYNSSIVYLVYYK